MDQNTPTGHLVLFLTNGEVHPENHRNVRFLVNLLIKGDKQFDPCYQSLIPSPSISIGYLPRGLNTDASWSDLSWAPTSNLHS